MGTPGEEDGRLSDRAVPGGGLEPGGENGGWTQSVPMIRTKLQAPNLSVAQSGKTTALRFPQDIYLSTLRAVDQARIASAPMVFVGYGVNAPERGWDDFKGVDLKGKVAVFLVNDPDFEAAEGEPVAGKFAGKTMTYYGRWTYKFEEAAAGAIAALIVHDTEGAGYGWNVVQSAAGENFNIVLPPEVQQPVLLQGWIGPVAAEMFKRAGHDLADLRQRARTTAFKPIALKAAFSANARVDLNRISTRNVIGKLTGSKYPNETVSYGGHWDAYGIGPADAQGRTIRPGASDDALGLAAMIEIARMFAAGPRPERTTGVRGWTAEEGPPRLRILCAAPAFPARDDGREPDAGHPADGWGGEGRRADRPGPGEMERLLAEAAQARGPHHHARRDHLTRAILSRGSFLARQARRSVLLNMALAGSYDLVNGGRAAGDKWLNDFTGNCYHQPCDATVAELGLAARFRRRSSSTPSERGSPTAASGRNGHALSEFAKVRERSAAARPSRLA